MKNKEWNKVKLFFEWICFLFFCVLFFIRLKWINFCGDFVFMCYYFNNLIVESDIKWSGFNVYLKKYILVF